MSQDQSKTTEKRVERLENLLGRIVDALYKKDSIRDGNWGHPSFYTVIGEVRKELGYDD